MTVDEIAEHLAMVAEGSGLKADAEALRLIAIQSEGGLRDALSLLDQCGVMSKQITTETVREVLGIVGREVLRALAEASASSADWILDSVTLSSALVASSSTRIGGFFRNTRAMAMRCFCPPESWLG